MRSVRMLTVPKGIRPKKGANAMLGTVLSLLFHSAFLMLRLEGGGNSFPRPLSAAEEKHYLALAAQGDEEARAVLIERNLRLVAHIIKNADSKGNLWPAPSEAPASVPSTAPV